MAYRPLLINFFIISIFSFCFAVTSIFPYKKVEASMLSSNPYVDLPVSDFVDDAYTNFANNKLKIYEEKNQLFFDFDGIKLENFSQLEDVLEKDIADLLYRNRFSIVLLMPEDISVDNLVRLENLLRGLGYRLIRYITKNNDENLVSRFDNRGLVKELHFINTPDSVSKISLPPEQKDSLISKTIQVYLGENEYLFGNKKIKKNELVEYFIKHIDSATQFNYVFNNSNTYQSYITLLASQKQAIQDLRYNDQRVELKFGENFRPVNRKEYEKDRERLFNKYPLLVTETYTE